MESLLGRDLKTFLPIHLNLLYHLELQKFCQKLIKSLFIRGPEVSNKLTVGFNVVRGFSEVGNEVQDIDLFHGYELGTIRRIRHQMLKCFGLRSKFRSQFWPRGRPASDGGFLDGCRF